MDADAIIASLVVLIILVLITLIFIVFLILRSPFHYPYFMHTFDVSRKRSVNIEDYIDRFLRDDANWQDIKRHEARIEQWKANAKQYLQSCILKRRRTKQYRRALDDNGAFRFTTVREQTRYR